MIAEFTHNDGNRRRFVGICGHDHHCSSAVIGCARAPLGQTSPADLRETVPSSSVRFCVLIDGRVAGLRLTAMPSTVSKCPRTWNCD